jgi:SpoVK/Ycf46/Vps4 family AAA+-type ATPase
VNLEEAVVQLARLGLKGDKVSVGRLVRRVLRDLAPNADVTEGTKKALAQLVADQPTSAMRFVDHSVLADHAPFLSVEPAVAGEEPLLAVEVQRQIDSIVSERERADALADVGLYPTRTILLTGLPGVGKTMTARSLARRLGLPLYGIDLSALMSSYLGKTGQNLTDVFAAARAVPSVLLLDEFDALGKRRDDPSDVGELKRIVNVLLTELEAWPSTGLIVAATNHPELLDRAIWRRFESVITIGPPTATVRRAVLERELKRLAQEASESVLEACVAATEAASCSDVVGVARAAVRRVVLDSANIDEVLSNLTLERLRTLAAADATLRALFCRVASDHLRMTQRAIGAELGISHVMVGKLLKQERPTAQDKR